MPPVDEAGQPLDLLLEVSRDRSLTLGAQVEDGLRRAIREGALRPGVRVPSTRDLSRQLGVSRRIAIDAYAQLAAEGYLVLRQGARPRVAETAAVAAVAEPVAAVAAPGLRFDFRPSQPDVSTFPRTAWLRSMREAIREATDADLGYGDPRGVEVLRATLADYLGRVRGVVADPANVMITCGFAQAQDIVLRLLAARGARRVGLEDPGDPAQREVAERAGLEPVSIPVDEWGVSVEALARADVDAVVLTPAHQHPTGVVLSGERRTALRAWLRERGAIALEDDYDAEYRYDRAAIGALQGIEPEHVVYAGSASKTLAPALRIGWLVVPADLVEAIGRHKLLTDRGTPRLEQLAFADFVARGELDRHLRRMRGRYRARRDAIVASLAEELPEATVRGIAAGLHATVELPEGYDERAIVEEARRRRIDFDVMAEHRTHAPPGPPTLLLGFAQVNEAAVRAGVREIAAIVRGA